MLQRTWDYFALVTLLRYEVTTRTRGSTHMVAIATGGGPVAVLRYVQ